MEWNWERELADLLNRLMRTQQQMLELITRKRDLLIRRDHAALLELSSEEQRLGDELQSCHEQRQQLLAKAASHGMPAESISSLVNGLPQDDSKRLQQSINEARQRSKLLRHHCLSQWVAMQKTMLHLSHLLEIIATRGQYRPTYGRGATPSNSGALMDQAV